MYNIFMQYKTKKEYKKLESMLEWILGLQKRANSSSETMKNEEKPESVNEKQ